MKEQKIIKETCVAGRTIDHVIKLPSGIHIGQRRKRSNITPEAVVKNNDRIAERNLTRLINTNFGTGSGHFTLTYKVEPETPQRGKKDIDYMMRKLRKEMRKHEQELKYIIVTEYKNRRIHHHVLLNTIDASMVDRLWGKGFIKMSILDNTGSYRKLAEYLIKETQKTFRDEDSPRRKRYSPSRNLVKPIIKREYVSGAELFNDPKPIKGYYIDQDSVRRYEHPVTGLEHLEYTEIAIKKPRKYKAWPRGKKVRGESRKKVHDVEQVSWLDEF